MAAFSRLIPVAASAYALQTALAAVFVPQANDKFYDLGGALGFFSTTLISLYSPSLKAAYAAKTLRVLPPLTSFAPRQLLLSAAIGIWCTRLGSFLVMRALKAGGDSRFDQIKHKPVRFSTAWFFQATWVFLVGLPVYMSNVLPAKLHPALGPRDYLSFGLFASSFLFEIIADHQKHIWRKEKDQKKHEEKFITSGLWSISRHPNYVGEIGLWTGIWALSSRALQTPYFPKWTVGLAAVSPLFTYFLLRYVSGVPLLERAGERKFNDDPKWQEYQRTVPVLFPWGGYH